MSSKCENVTSNAAANGIIDDIFDTLTHVDASVNVGLGLTAEAEVDIGGISFEDAAPYSLLETSYALPTACMSFDAGAKSYVAATATPSSTSTSTTKAHDGAKSGAAGAVVSPFGSQGAGSMKGMMVVSGLMVVGSFFFMLL